jgi:gluconate kinase
MNYEKMKKYVVKHIFRTNKNAALFAQAVIFCSNLKKNHRKILFFGSFKKTLYLCLTV